MSLNIQEILGFVPLTKALETVKSGVPRLLPDAFYARNPAFKVLGNRARRVETQGTRRNAKLTPYGAPSRQINHLPLSSRDVTLVHVEERIKFSPELYLQIRELDRYVVQQQFKDEITRQVMNAKTRQINLETSMVNVMLANGQVWFDADGALLASSSGADLTINYGIPAGNLNQVSGIIDASWATATTNIVQHINNIKQRVLQLTGYKLKYCLYGKNIMSYLLNNNQVKEYLRYQTGSDMSAYFLKSGQIPPGLFDLEWIPMQDTFFDTESGTVTEIFGADTVTFTPDPADPMVYGVYEGTYPIPSGFGVTGSVEQQLSNIQQASGAYGYGLMELDPIGIVGVYGDTFLPSLNTPSSFVIADVTP